MKNGLVYMMLLASLMGAGASAALAQASQPSTGEAVRAETEVRRLNAEEVAAFLHNDPKAVVWGGKMPNVGKTEHLRFTGIWMKQRGRWQEVARHANIVH